MAEKKSVSVNVLNMAGEEVGKISLAASVFGIEPHKQAMFNAVQVEQSNSRQATAKTKVRHEVSGGGKKPWRQKGTGRARAGSSDPQCGSVVEPSLDQLVTKTSPFPKTEKNIN